MRDFERFASERSHQDAKVSNDLFRAAAQAAIPINGGAATAILALAQKSPSPYFPIVSFAAALFIYGIGVLLGALAVYATASSAQKWAERWEMCALSGGCNSSEIKEVEAAGEKWHSMTVTPFLCSAACFSIATIIMALAILRMP